MIGPSRMIPNCRRFHHKHSGFSLLETIFALSLFSLVLTLAIKPFQSKIFQDEIADKVYMNQLKGAITNQRIRAAKEQSLSYSFVLNATGKVRFSYSGKDYLVIENPNYQVMLKGVQWASILTTTDFRNQSNQGQHAFSINIYRNERLIGELVFQVGTSTFREKYYGPN